MANGPRRRCRTRHDCPSGSRCSATWTRGGRSRERAKDVSRRRSLKRRVSLLLRDMRREKLLAKDPADVLQRLSTSDDFCALRDCGRHRVDFRKSQRQTRRPAENRGRGFARSADRKQYFSLAGNGTAAWRTAPRAHFLAFIGANPLTSSASWK